MKRALGLRRGLRAVALAALLSAGGGLGWWTWRFRASLQRTQRLRRYLQNPTAYAAWRVPARARCGAAPFLTPTAGYIGYLWGDSFRPGHRHTGLDIFAGTPVGQTPVYAVYPGRLYRLASWTASVIVRHQDPLHPGRVIWTYYTHMADAAGRSLIAAAFPPGTQGEPVEAGTLLGYQGNFSGTPGVPVGVHLHFSIVRSTPQGDFLDERCLANTLDPSPYLGFVLRADQAPSDVPPTCPRPWALPLVTPGGP